MAALPLDGLISLVADDLVSPAFEKFWHHNSLKWPLLRRVRLTTYVAVKFAYWLLGDNGGREDPLLPSLKEFVLVGADLDESQVLGLFNVLTKRVDLGVPLEMLDLWTCLLDPDFPGAVEFLSDIGGVDILGPEETLDARTQIRNMWDLFDYGPFIDHENYGEANQLDASDDGDDSDTGGDDDEDDED